MLTKTAQSIAAQGTDYVTHKELQDNIVHGATGGLLGYGLGGLPGMYLGKKYPKAAPLIAVAGATIGDIIGTSAAVKFKGVFKKNNQKPNIGK